jgi:ribosomal protein S2
VCDTNANPVGITHPIPCNDDAIKALQLLADYFQAAVETGKAKSKSPEKAEDKKD